MSKKEAAEKIRFYSFLSRKDRGRVKAMWVNQKKKKEGEKKNAFLKSKKKKKKNEGDVIHSTIFFLPIPFFSPFLSSDFLYGWKIHQPQSQPWFENHEKKKKDKKKNKRFKIPPPLLSNTTSIYHSQAQ